MSNSVFKLSSKMKISILGMIAEGFFSGSIFLALFAILDLVFGEGVTTSKLFNITGLVGFIFLCRLILYIISYTGCQIAGSAMSRTIRVFLGNKFSKIPLRFFNKNRTGFYINAATSEVADYEQILTHKIASIIQISCLLAMMGIYAATIHVVCGILLLVSSLLLIPTTIVSIKIVNKYGKEKNEAREHNVSSITEYLSGSQTLRSYGLVGTKNEALTKAMKHYSVISYDYEKTTLPAGFIFQFCSYIAMALTIVIAVNTYLAGAMNAAQLVILIMLPTFTAALNLTNFINVLSIKNLSLSKRKLSHIFEEQEENQADKTFSPQNYEIAFKNIDFSYIPNEPVLKDVSFTIPNKKFTAIVGDSGSGKSTILNLITKYYEWQGGEITLGGRNTKHISSEQILSYISLVDQNVFLFNDTVKNNIRYAKPDATDEEIYNACKLANCESFIKKMEKGYDSEIGENGNRLSGGERQRLSIARAILRNSPILLLDEATASLDIENELLVKEAITNLLKTDKTVVMIAHTLPIIQQADLILVLKNGQIKESGAHHELLAINGKYKAMWQASQLLR